MTELQSQTIPQKNGSGDPSYKIMPSNANAAMTTPIDPAFIDRIVRRVIAQLRQSSSNIKPANNTAASISDKIVTATTIENVTGSPSQIFVAAGTIVTPAAIDAAKERGIEINKTTAVLPAQQPKPENDPTNQEIIDQHQPDRAVSVATQLARRGITMLGSRIVLSDSPAAEVHRCISTEACRAAMVTAIADVDRFQLELRPQVWVLDMGRMNLITAVNVAARIAQLGN